METSYETKIDRFGRVLIPKGVREDLGLSPGTVLTIEQRGKEIALYTISEEPTLVYEGKVLVAKVKALQNLSGMEKKLRLGRLSKLWGRPGE